MERLNRLAAPKQTAQLQRAKRVPSAAPSTNKQITAKYRVPIPQRSTSNRKGAAARKVANAGKVTPPKEEVDTRTAEEIDASYQKTLAKYMAAKQSYEAAYTRKMNELEQALGIKATTRQAMNEAMQGGGKATSDKENDQLIEVNKGIDGLVGRLGLPATMLQTKLPSKDKIMQGDVEIQGIEKRIVNCDVCGRARFNTRTCTICK